MPQALNYLGGMLLLLTELREEEAFWLLLFLCQRGVPDFYSKVPPTSTRRHDACSAARVSRLLTPSAPSPTTRASPPRRR